MTLCLALSFDIIRQMNLALIFLAISNLLLFGLVFYQNITHREERERKDEMIKDLELKFISKNVADYDSVRSEEPQNMNKETEDKYRPLEDVSLEELVNAEDNL